MRICHSFLFDDGSVKSFPLFKNWVVFLMSFESSVYILVTNPLSDVCVQMFSPIRLFQVINVASLVYEHVGLDSLGLSIQPSCCDYPREVYARG